MRKSYYTFHQIKSTNLTYEKELLIWILTIFALHKETRLTIDLCAHEHVKTHLALYNSLNDCVACHWYDGRMASHRTKVPVMAGYYAITQRWQWKRFKPDTHTHGTDRLASPGVLKLKSFFSGYTQKTLLPLEHNTILCMRTAFWTIMWLWRVFTVLIL